MSTTEVNCTVKVPEAMAFGQFANAIRILPEVGEECFIDFCVYSAQSQEAIVVSRIRVKKSLIPILIQRMQGFCQPAPIESAPVGEPMVFSDGQARLPDGRILVFGSGGDEEN